MIAAKIKIGKALVDNLTQEEVITAIEGFISRGERTYVVTPNVDHIVKLEEDEEFAQAYANAGLVLADGNPVVLASRVLGSPLKALVTGSDLFPKLCERAAEKGYTVYFLGGLEGVAEKAARNLRSKHPELKVAGIYSPPFGFHQDQAVNQRIINDINAAEPHLLFVGVGAPKQEKWMYRNIGSLKTNVALGIGASFDFEAGTVKRAPKAFRKMGMEWLWRFINEPRRLFQRYFIDGVKFIPIILQQKRTHDDRSPSRKNLDQRK